MVVVALYDFPLLCITNYIDGCRKLYMKVDFLGNPSFGCVQDY